VVPWSVFALIKGLFSFGVGASKSTTINAQ